MTLLTDTPVAGGQPPATTPAASVPPSGTPVAPASEQTATGKDKAAPVAPAAPAGKEAVDNGQGKPAAEAKAAPQGAPETYDFKPSPDGQTLEEQPRSALSEVARDLNLTNDAAQKIVDKMAPALRAQTLRNVESMVAGWIAETKADPEIGGAKLGETQALAQRAMAYATPELRKLLGPVSEGGSGLGNHKAIIAWAAALGRRLSPDTKVVTGSQPTPPPLTAVERLAGTYGNA